MPGLQRDSKGDLTGRSAADLAHVLRSKGLGTTTAGTRAVTLVAVEWIDLNGISRHPGGAVSVVSMDSTAFYTGISNTSHSSKAER